MTDNVRLITTEPNAGVIEMLEKLTERARRGEIIAVTGVTMTAGCDFAEFFSNNSFDSAITFLSYLRVLQMRFERQIQMD